MLESPVSCGVEDTAGHLYANYNMLNLHQSMSIEMVQAGITNFKVCMKIC